MGDSIDDLASLLAGGLKGLGLFDQIHSESEDESPTAEKEIPERPMTKLDFWWQKKPKERRDFILKTAQKNYTGWTTESDFYKLYDIMWRKFHMKKSEVDYVLDELDEMFWWSEVERT